MFRHLFTCMIHVHCSHYSRKYNSSSHINPAVLLIASFRTARCRGRGWKIKNKRRDAVRRREETRDSDLYQVLVETTHRIYPRWYQYTCYVVNRTRSQWTKLPFCRRDKENCHFGHIFVTCILNSAKASNT